MDAKTIVEQYHIRNRINILQRKMKDAESEMEYWKERIEMHNKNLAFEESLLIPDLEIKMPVVKLTSYNESYDDFSDLTDKVYEYVLQEIESARKDVHISYSSFVENFNFEHAESHQNLFPIELETNNLSDYGEITTHISLGKHHKDQAYFEEIASIWYFEICTYKLFGDNTSDIAKGVLNAIAFYLFDKWITIENDF